MKTYLTLGGAILGLALGYVAGNSEQSGSSTNQKTSSNASATSSTVNRSSADSSNPRTVRNSRAPQEEVGLTREQADLILEEPSRFILSYHKSREANNFLDQTWWTDLAKFLGLEESQAARFDQKMRTFSTDAYEIIQNQSVVNSTVPGKIQIDLGHAASGFHQRLESFGDELKSVLGDRDYSRLKAVTDLDALGDRISKQTKFEIRFNALPSSDQTILQFEIDRSHGDANPEQFRIMLQVQNDQISEQMRNMKPFERFIPDLDWDQFVKQRIDHP